MSGLRTRRHKKRSSDDDIKLQYGRVGRSVRESRLVPESRLRRVVFVPKSRRIEFFLITEPFPNTVNLAWDISFPRLVPICCRDIGSGKLPIAETQNRDGDESSDRIIMIKK